MNWYFEHAGWLYTKIYQNEFFFFDLWSIVHCWSGFVLFLALKALHSKKPLSMLLTILFIYELLEIAFTYFALNIFQPETIKDQFTDIIIGMLFGTIGFLIVHYVSLSKAKHIRNLNFFVIFLASITYAYIWVGFYRYHYNNTLFDTPGINIGGFTFWTMGAFATIFGSTLIKIKNIWLKMSIVWAIYIFCLFAVEYFGFVLMGWHESSKENATPLLFDLIHGTRTLHIVYIISPFISISIYSGLKKLLFQAMKSEKRVIKYSTVQLEKKVKFSQVSVQQKH